MNFIGQNQATLDAQSLNRIIYIGAAYTVTFTNITFKNGKLTSITGLQSHGGAVFIYNGGSGYFTNCNFINNYATNGGAIRIDTSCSGGFTNCNFTNNTAKNYGGAVYTIACNFTNCNFTNNTANQPGGAVLMFSGSGFGYLTNCNFIGNTGMNGGAVYVSGSNDFTNCNFIGNTGMNGGAVYVISSGDFTNCNFIANTATNEGDAVYVSGSGDFTNCNFTDNVTDKTKSVIYKVSTSSSLFLNGNSIVTNSTPIYINAGEITSSTVLVVLNNQTVKSPLDAPVTLTAVLYDDNGNIIGSGTGITLNVAESSLTANFNRNNLNYSVSYTPTVSGVFPVSGTVPTTVANNVTEYKNGTLITGITTLSVNLTVNNTSPVVDDLIQYIITIKNNGAYKAYNITVEDILDTSKLEYVKCSPEDEYNPDTSVWLVENLDINQEASLNITVRVKSSGDINNTVTVKSHQISEDIIKNLTVVVSKKTLNTNDVQTEILNNSYGNTIVRVTVPADVTGNITIQVNGENYTGKIENGIATVELFNLTPGKYTTNVIYSGDDNYNPISTEMDLEVVKADINSSSIKSEILNNSYGNTTVKVTVPVNTTGNITITVNGEDYKGIIANGSAIIKLTNVTAGNHTMTITYCGDGNYNSVSVDRDLEVVKSELNPTLMVVETINNTYGNTYVSVTVPDNVTGNITIKVNNKNFTEIIKNGIATFNLSNLTVGNYTMNVTYNGDNNYKSVSKEQDLEVVKANIAKFEVETLNNTYGNTTIKVTVPKDATGIITIKADNETYEKEIANGSAIIKLANLTAGNHTLNITYSGDDNYNSKNTTEKLEVVKSSINSTDMVIEVLNNTYQNVTVEIILPNDVTGNVTIKVNGNEYKGNISNGSAIIKLKEIPVGKYTMNVTYNGDNNYNTISKNVDLEIVKSELNPEDVKVEIINNTSGNITIKVTVPDNETGNITVKIGDKSYNGTVENGSAIIKIPNVNSGNYTANVTFEGNNYNPISEEIQLEIIKAIINLPIEDVNITYGETETITVWLPEDATGYIVFDVNGTKNTIYINQIITAAIGDKQYSSTFNDLKAGEYTTTITYSGDEKYETITNSTTFQVLKAELNPDELKVDIINNTPGNVTLNITVPKDATGNITVTIGNETYNGTIENGSVIIKLPTAPIGNSTINITYDGDENYEPIAKQENITVDKYTLNPDDLKTEILNNTYGNTTVKITVPENVTGDITIAVGNKTYNAPIVNGSAIVSLPDVPAGNHTMTIIYSGDDNYDSIAKEEQLEIAKNILNPSDIKVDIINNTFGNTTVKVTLPEDATGNITIAIGNKTYNATIANGSAIIKLPDVPAGNHTMTITYSGDNNYNKTTIEKELTIEKATINPDDIQIIVDEDDEGNTVITIIAPPNFNDNITLEIAGKNYTVEVINGTGSLTIPKLPDGKYDIIIRFDGNDNFNSFTKYLTIEINSENTQKNNTSIAKAQNATKITNPNSLENIKTANPILLLLLILLAIPLRKRKVD